MGLEGQQVGHYRIVRQIGRGGMGEVYLAQDTRMPRQVAIKVVRSERTPYPNSSSAQEAARLFQREMAALSQLDHPNILSIYDFGEEQINGEAVTYMVMPYRPEGSLADWMAHRSNPEPLSPQEVGRFIAQAAAALQHSHDNGIIHQDVKPSNFLMRVRPEQPTQPDLLLVDFGVAKLTTSVTQTNNSVRGTALYMPPEQWNRAPVPATDQYALAVMTYQLLTGVPPFTGSPEQVMMQHLTVLPKLPSELNPRLSHAVDAVLIRAMAKKPEQRFHSVLAFATALQQAIAYRDLRTTLTINQAEATSGGNRTIMLPGKRQVTVTIPPNIQQQQELQLAEQGEPYYDGGPRGPLLLTISPSQTAPIAKVAEPPSAISPGNPYSMPQLPNGDFGQQYAPVAPIPPPPPDSSPSSNIKPPSGPQMGAYLYQHQPYTELAVPWSQQQLEEQRKEQGKTSRSPFYRYRFALIAAALVVILGGIGIAVIVNPLHPPKPPVTVNTAATAQALAQSANATAAATNAIATVIASNPDPYTPPNGKLALNDPLSQTQTWNNSINTSFGGQCQFANGVFEATQTRPSVFICTETGSIFSNFAFEVQMTVTQGDCGGMTVRGTSDASFKLYMFVACTDGSYSLYRYINGNSNTATDLTNGFSTAIQKGINQANLLAVVANNNTLSIYINHQKIANTADNTYSQGYLGLIAYNVQHTTTVDYRNARVWTF